MKLKSPRMLLPLLAALAFAALAPTADAATPTPGGSAGASPILYVQETDGASLRHTRSGGFELRLTGVSPRVSTLAERPGLPAGSSSLRTLVSRWSQAGFTADPPRAALVPARGGRSSDVAMLTLTHPRYDSRRGILSYQVKPLHERDLGALAAFAKRAGPVRSGSFGSTSLVVTNGAGEVNFETITFSVSNAAPGEPLNFYVTPDGGRVAWDIPPANRDANGLQLLPEHPGMPLTRLYATSSLVAVETAATGGSPFNYKLIATFELEGSQSAYVSFSRGSYSGPQPAVVVSYTTNLGVESEEMSPGAYQVLTSLIPS